MYAKSLAQGKDILQRKYAGGKGSEGTFLQRTAINAVTPTSVQPIVREVLSSTGRLLDAGTRAFMEPRFGHDFSQVRVHTDTRAAESAEAVNALAYTVGRDVVFGARQYAPETSEGRRLMAHELTHVVQQGESVSAPHGISSSDDSQEREASSVASAVQTGQSTSINARGSSSLLQRQEDLRLRMPQFPGRQRRQISLFPPGQRPRLHLDMSVLRPLFELQGISNLRPVGQPRLFPGLGNPPPAFLPGTSPSSASTPPHVPAADDPNKIVDLDFNLDIETMSLMAYTLARLGFPLQTPAEQEQQQIDQLQAIFSGREVEDTPLGLRLLSTGINYLYNVLGDTPTGSRILERRILGTIKLKQLTFVINPATGTYGLSAQFLIP